MANRETKDGEEGRGSMDREAITSQIEETKSAIGEDLRALGEHISPEKLREGARAVMHDAREEAKGLLREVKSEAVDSLRSARDSAVESVTETVDEVAHRAKRMGREAAGFLTTNAAPLALIGMGVGWMMLMQRRESTYSPSRRAPTMYRAGHAGQRSMGGDEHRGQGMGERAMDTAHELEARGSDLVHRVSERGSELAHRVSERGSELAEQLEDRLRDGRSRTMDYAQESPLGAGAIVAAIGIGVGLAMPSSTSERQLVRRTGLVEEAQETASRVGDTARYAARELASTLRDRA